MSSSSGTKVTTDPESQRNPKSEGAGEVTSDSLAGESLKSGGSFGSTTGAAASGQKSAGTTANNTDTSGATTLQAAPDAEARQASEGWSEQSQLQAGSGLGKDAGVGPTYNTSNNSGSGPSSGTGGKAYSAAAGGSSGIAGGSSGGSSNAGTAPSYTGDPYGKESKPHGQSIKEGGFDSGAPNASFNQDVGGKNDPARAALQGFQKSDARAGGDVGSSAPDTKVSNDGQFEALGGDTEA